MRYERLENLVRLAVHLQGTPAGLTLDDIQADFSVSRSTAERMRNAVEAAFGPLDLVDGDDPKRHWRLRSDAVRRLVAIAPEELAELESAASALERVGLEERAGTLRDFATKVRATLRTESLALLEVELEALVQAEGLAMRAGPRTRLDAGLLSALREAITTHRLVKFRYLLATNSTVRFCSTRRVGALFDPGRYGNIRMRNPMEAIMATIEHSGQRENRSHIEFPAPFYKRDGRFTPFDWAIKHPAEAVWKLICRRRPSS